VFPNNVNLKLHSEEASMGYQVKLEGFESQTIEAELDGIFSGPKLLVNGRPALKGKKRGQMTLQRDDGREVIATWKPQSLGFDLPQLVMDGQTVQLVEPLKWYQLLWSALPLLLIFFGGAIGGATGAIAAVINTRIFRYSNLNVVLQFIITGVVSVLAGVVYLVVASLFLRAVGG
jgi:hypothetical protein